MAAEIEKSEIPCVYAEKLKLQPMAAEIKKEQKSLVFMQRS